MSASSRACVAAGFVGRENALAVFVGMLGPLVATVITWVLSDRTYQTESVTVDGRDDCGVSRKSHVLRLVCGEHASSAAIADDCHSWSVSPPSLSVCISRRRCCYADCSRGDVSRPGRRHDSPGSPGTRCGRSRQVRCRRDLIGHVSNSGLDHPLIHLPKVFGIDVSVTKHVLMLWLVAVGVFVITTWAVRRYLRQDRLVPSGFMNGLEAVVEFVRDPSCCPTSGGNG